MSHIHDALKKAQQEKDSLYTHYGGVIGASERAAARRPLLRPALLVSALIVLVFAGVWFLKKEMPGGAKEGDGRALKTQSLSIAPGGEEEKGKADKVPALDALYDEALRYQKKGLLDKAEDIYGHILKEAPAHAAALNNLGVIFLAKKDMDRARTHFERAIAHKMDYVDPYYNLACLYSREGNRVKGLEYLEKALRLNNDVKNWAKNDRDLEGLRRTDQFRALMELRSVH